MEHSIEYYKTFLSFLEYAFEHKQLSYTYESASEHFGDYWMAICKYLKENKLANVNYGNLYVHQLPPLMPIMADCKAMIEKIEKAEYDRNVDHKYKIKGILYGKISLIISAIAFVFSTLVALRQLGIF